MNATNNTSTNAPIGIMDSGVGGLTVLKEISALMPEEELLYVADSDYFPYGEKTREQVAQRVIKISLWFVTHGCKAIVIACNTATVAGLEAARTHFKARGLKVPILGVIHAGSIEAVKATQNGRIGVLATPVTVESKAYTFGIKAAAEREVYVQEVGTPALTTFVENELAELDVDVSPSAKFSAAQKQMAREYLQPLVEAEVDTIVLGCTHYPLATELLSEVLAREIQFVSPSVSTAEELKFVLSKFHLASEDEVGSINLRYTGQKDEPYEQKFAKMYSLVFGELPDAIEPCSLDDAGPKATANSTSTAEAETLNDENSTSPADAETLNDENSTSPADA